MKLFMSEQKMPEENSKDQSRKLSGPNSGLKNEIEVHDVPQEPVTGNQQPETIADTEPQPLTMEVHKHPHDVMHKKKLAEYVLEFLMIFLAVFLGFLAENWREHIVDRRREKELMTAFVNDLKLDTAQLSGIIRWRVRQGHRLDSTIQFYSGQTFPRVPLRAFQMSFRLFALSFFYQNTGTLDQLKNSGGFRFN